MEDRQSASVVCLGTAQVGRVGGEPHVQVHHRGVGVHLLKTHGTSGMHVTQSSFAIHRVMVRAQG